MTAFRTSGYRGFAEEMASAGDTFLLPDTFSLVTTVGATTLLAASMVTGVLYRSGSTGAYTDTFDTAINIYNALTGNGNNPVLVPGMGFKMRLVNSVAFIETITLGSGMTAGSGVIATVSASTWREFLFTFNSVQQPVSNIALTTNGSNVVTWYLLPGQAAEPQGISPLAVNVVVGATVVGTGIAANTVVTGITEGQGGTLGFTMNNNATATGTVALTFGPALIVSGLGSGTL